MTRATPQPNSQADRAQFGHMFGQNCQAILQARGSDLVNHLVIETGYPGQGAIVACGQPGRKSGEKTASLLDLFESLAENCRHSNG